MSQTEYPNINVSESIGTTFNVILKGATQLGAQTLNETLDPSQGLVSILAVGFVVAGVVFLLERLVAGKRVANELLG
jgi:hypothetical protein